MTINEDVNGIIVEPAKLPDNEREKFARVAMLNQLLGRQCATCNFDYKTESDLKEHGCIGGYDTDIVGRGNC